jgi:hypothetical protein
MRPPRIGALVALLAGCGSTAPAPDAGGADTASPTVDASLSPDAATGPDALDAGPPDAPLADVVTDAEPAPDAEDMDASTDAAPADAGTAIGKFCHELSRGGQPVLLTLQLGDPPSARIMAWTGRCAPPRGLPCEIIPAGVVPVRLFEGDRLLGEREVILGGGNEYVFQAVITGNLQLAITGGRITPGSCASLDFPSDGGATD